MLGELQDGAAASRRARRGAGRREQRCSETICRFAQLAVEQTDLVELEVNPLVASAGGVIAVDARAQRV